MNSRVIGAALGSVVILTLGIVIGLQWPGEAPDRTARDVAGDTFLTGPFRVQIAVDPETPTIGDNTVHIGLSDLQGAAVTDARIAVTAVMRAMGAMPEMRVPAGLAETAPGQYEGVFTLSMDGSWPLTIEIEKAGLGEARLSFDMATRRPGLELLAGANRPERAQSSIEEVDLPGTITVDARRRQLIGVTLGEARRMPLERQIRAVGRVTYDETRLSDVSLRFDAWVGELQADYIGARVEEGQPLFTVYGPALLAAQQEYLEVKSRLGTGSLVDAIRKRLELWDMTDAEIASLEQRGSPLDYVPIMAPRSGTVVIKNIVEGTSHTAGMTLMRIADLSRVWVEAQVYEADLAMVAVGNPAVVTLPYLPEQTFNGVIEYIYPFLDEVARTTRVRLSLDNSADTLKPDMYADVTLQFDLGQRLLVPVDAVIFAGESRVVFEDLGEGRLAPRRIQTGLRNAEYIEVLGGLDEGARVVTSGTFLIASESRLASGLDQW